MASANEQWLQELAKRTGSSVEASDIARLDELSGPNVEAHNAGDYEAMKRAYEHQYARRGASGQTGSGEDGAVWTARGYGSGSNELAEERGGTFGSGGSGSVASQWNGGGGSSFGSSGSMFPDWYQNMMERQQSMAEEQFNQNKERSSALWTNLQSRAGQGLDVARTNPAVRAQADAFSANQRRAQRNYLGDIAERGGQYMNMRGEERMAAERYGATTGAFEAGLVGKEIDARRQEITHALSTMGQLLSGDQMRQLQLELSQLDQASKEAQLGLQAQGQQMGYDTNMRQLGLQDWDRQMYWDMTQRGVI